MFDWLKKASCCGKSNVVSPAPIKIEVRPPVKKGAFVGLPVVIRNIPLDERIRIRSPEDTFNSTQRSLQPIFVRPRGALEDTALSQTQIFGDGIYTGGGSSSD